jgi:hypothetical protein
VETLHNLADTSYGLIGLPRLTYLEQTLQATQRIGFYRLMITQGIEGNEDVPTSRTCRVFK